MSNLSKREKNLIFIMICVVICFVVGYLLILPSKKKYDKLYDQKGATFIEKQNFANKIMDTDKWEKQLADAESTNLKLSEHFYKKMSNDEIDKIFTTYAINNSVKIKALEISDYVEEVKQDASPDSAGDETSKDDSAEGKEDKSAFKKISVSLKVTGSNANIIALIANIENDDKTMMQNFTIQKSDEEYSGDISIRLNMLK